MKIGKTIAGLMDQVEEEARGKKDFVAETRALKLVTDEQDVLGLQINGHGRFGVSQICHEQMASRLAIPQKYYDRMKAESPYLLINNVNHWFGAKPEKRLVRTLAGNARAFLSDRYRPMDHFDLLEAVIPKIKGSGCRIESCEVTERRIYIKAITERVTANIAKGDVVQAGIVVSNSEVGCGSVRIEPLLYRLVCLNGMIANDFAMRKYHVGRAGEEFGEDGASVFYRNETRIADDKAFWMKVSDTVDATLDRDRFQKIADRFRATKENVITGDIPAVVELAATRFGMSDAERAKVLHNLIHDGELSQFGLANAVTRTSQEIEDYDRATEFERMGWEVVQLPNRDWEKIANAN